MSAGSRGCSLTSALTFNHDRLRPKMDIKFPMSAFTLNMSGVGGILLQNYFWTIEAQD